LLVIAVIVLVLETITLFIRWGKEGKAGAKDGVNEETFS
jgi:hypothetical protein